jgi:hypothetical protein
VAETCCDTGLSPIQVNVILGAAVGDVFVYNGQCWEITGSGIGSDIYISSTIYTGALACKDCQTNTPGAACSTTPSVTPSRTPTNSISVTPTISITPSLTTTPSSTTSYLKAIFTPCCESSSSPNVVIQYPSSYFPLSTTSSIYYLGECYKYLQDYILPGFNGTVNIVYETCQKCQENNFIPL